MFPFTPSGSFIECASSRLDSRRRAFNINIACALRLPVTQQDQTYQRTITFRPHLARTIASQNTIQDLHEAQWMDFTSSGLVMAMVAFPTLYTDTSNRRVRLETRERDGTSKRTLNSLRLHDRHYRSRRGLRSNIPQFRYPSTQSTLKAKHVAFPRMLGVKEANSWRECENVRYHGWRHGTRGREVGWR